MSFNNQDTKNIEYLSEQGVIMLLDWQHSSSTIYAYIFMFIQEHLTSHFQINGPYEPKMNANLLNYDC